MKQTYDEALQRLLVHEGGYTNHPSDPGGPTNFGITIFDYRKYVKPGATAADVKAMRLDEAKAIYKAKYWDAQRCDELPVGLDYAVFDYGVNSGIGRSGKVLRRIVKLSDATSVVNNDVLQAVKQYDSRNLITTMCDERLRFLKALKTWPVFGAGWGRRVAEVRAAALHMNDVAAKATTAPAPQPTAPTPATVPAKGQVPVNGTAQAGTTGGIVVAGAAAAQQSGQAGISPGVIVTIVIVTIVLAVAGYAFWHWHQSKAQTA